jgi:Lon protease-like protein
MTETDRSKMNIYDLPLFPLKTVLFPGMPLPLHIFEERYKLMIQTCLDAGQVFGVVLIRKGREALGPLADTYPIGCTARITQVEQLPDGRMNILAIGHERFRMLSLDNQSMPYLIGTVKSFPFVEPGLESNRDVSGQLMPRLKRYLQVLSKMSESEFDLEQLPDDPQTLAYLAAIALQVPQKEKQRLLSIAGSDELLAELNAVYSKEVSLMEVITSGKPADSIGHFSVN